jgi:aspartokinase/homoserine dehydrogenase 1
VENLEVIKFGGTSLSNSALLKSAVSIVSQKRKQSKIAIIVSALGGVTDQLIHLLGLAEKNDSKWIKQLQDLKERHFNTALELLSGTRNKSLFQVFDSLLAELELNLQYISKHREISSAQKDLVLSTGERLSCHLFNSLLQEHNIPSQPFESQHLIRTDNQYGNAKVDFKVTKQLVKEVLLPVNGKIPVITGYIGSTENGEITTLGRSGSDYTAGIIGKILGARKVEIWTDVNGVFTTDPNSIPTALPIPNLHYSEMAEMAHFGANVLHPSTVLPLEQLNIPIVIKNTFDPAAQGTLVNSEKDTETGLLRSVSIKNDLALIGLKSYGLEKIPSLLTRALTVLHEENVNVYFNASAYSNLGFSLAVSGNQSSLARKQLLAEFSDELGLKLLEPPVVSTDISMITVIGNQLYQDNGLTGKILAVLADNHIVPMAYAKEVENRRFTFILPTLKAVPAIRLINDHFCISSKRVRLFIAGVGTIGGALLNQLDTIKNDSVEYNIIGACDSKKMIWNNHGFASGEIKKQLAHGDPTDWSFIVDKLTSEFSYRTIFVDATGKSVVAGKYKKLLESGVHIATPSKIANTSNQEYFDTLQDLTKSRKVYFKYETTVGAGLPVIQTIKDLCESGDKIKKIIGSVSGTMTYLFGELEKGQSFSESIIKARELGYTEPDPRDDLSGEDVARKFMTLARTIGHRLERRDVKVESLVPDALSNVSRDDFIKMIKDYDKLWHDKVEQAKDENKALRYIGNFVDGQIIIKVQAVPVDSPIGSLKGTDNLLAIYTSRYHNYPLIIQGPGAGREVTAGGLLSDIQKIGNNLIY